MPRTEEQYELIRENKKQLIMDTALELFANEGYFTTSIGKIAERAGIAKGLIYNYFDSKEELIKEIMLTGIDQLFESLDPNKDGILTDEEFVYFINTSFRIIDEKRDFYRLYFSVMFHPHVFTLLYEKLMDFMPVLNAILVPFFKRKGIEDPEGEVLFFGAILDGLGMNHISNPDSFPLDKLKKRIFKLYNIEIKE
ncbi:TetR/AcrR family transcriptional regulator [Bacteroidota bacterium]